MGTWDRCACPRRAAGPGPERGQSSQPCCERLNEALSERRFKNNIWRFLKSRFLQLPSPCFPTTPPSGGGQGGLPGDLLVNLTERHIPRSPSRLLRKSPKGLRVWGVQPHLPKPPACVADPGSLSPSQLCLVGPHSLCRPPWPPCRPSSKLTALPPPKVTSPSSR